MMKVCGRKYKKMPGTQLYYSETERRVRITGRPLRPRLYSRLELRGKRKARKPKRKSFLEQQVKEFGAAARFM